MGRVKGTMLVEFVKSIRANKDMNLDDYFTEQDKEVIAGQVLSSQWYPEDTYLRCFDVVVKTEAKSDMDTVRQWGHTYGEAIITSVYKNIIIQGNPHEMFKKHIVINKLLFDFVKYEVEEISETSALLRIKGVDPNFEPFYHMVRGWMERIAELCGAKNIRSEFASKSWQGDPETSIKFEWEL